MRLRLSIQRNALPVSQVHWILKDDQASKAKTVDQFLQDVDEIFPLEAAEWGLEDYVVEVDGFECLHFMELHNVFKEGDHVTIRPLQTSEVRSRYLAGRTQITSDGRHLLDGIGYGKRYLRRPDRPDVHIPPKKRRKLTQGDDEDIVDAISSQAVAPLLKTLMGSVVDGSGKEDGPAPYSEAMQEARKQSFLAGLTGGAGPQGEDGGYDEEEDYSEAEEAEFEAMQKAKQLADKYAQTKAPPKTLRSGTKEKRKRKSVRFMDPPQTNGNSALVRFNGDLDSEEDEEEDEDFEPVSEDASDDETDETSDSDASDDQDEDSESDSDGEDSFDGLSSGSSSETESSEASTSSDESDEDAPEVMPIRPSGKASDKPKDNTAVPQAQSATKPAIVQPSTTPPGQGKRSTQLRNQRRMESKRRRSLEARAAQGDAEAAVQLEKTKTAKATRNAAKTDASSAEFAAARQRLLDALEAGGVDVGTYLLPAPVSNESEIPTEADASKSTSSNKAPLDEPDTQFESQGSGAADETTPRKRARLDMASSRRLLFGSLGLKAPKSKADEDKLRVDLKAKADSLPGAKKVLTADKADGDGQAAEPEEPVDLNAWKKKIKLSAIECVDDDIELSTPPFPFVQRWDPSQQLHGKKGKKRKRNSAQFYAEEAYEGVEAEIEEPSITLNYDDPETTPNGADQPAPSVEEAVNGDEAEAPSPEKTPSTPSVIVDDLPFLPKEVQDLPALQAHDIQPGVIFAFKQLEMSERTNWQPIISAYKTAKLLIFFGNGAFRVQLAVRDRPRREVKYDDKGDRVFSKFEMAGYDSEEGELEDDGELELRFTDLIDPKLVQAAPQKEKEKEQAVVNGGTDGVNNDQPRDVAAADASEERICDEDAGFTNEAAGSLFKHCRSQALSNEGAVQAVPRASAAETKRSTGALDIKVKIPENPAATAMTAANGAGVRNLHVKTIQNSELIIVARNEQNDGLAEAREILTTRDERVINTSAHGGMPLLPRNSVTAYNGERLDFNLSALPDTVFRQPKPGLLDDLPLLPRDITESSQCRTEHESVDPGDAILFKIWTRSPESGFQPSPWMVATFLNWNRDNEMKAQLAPRDKLAENGHGIDVIHQGSGLVLLRLASLAEFTPVRPGKEVEIDLQERFEAPPITAGKTIEGSTFRSGIVHPRAITNLEDIPLSSSEKDWRFQSRCPRSGDLLQESLAFRPFEWLPETMAGILPSLPYVVKSLPTLRQTDPQLRPGDTVVYRSLPFRAWKTIEVVDGGNAATGCGLLYKARLAIRDRPAIGGEGIEVINAEEGLVKLRPSSLMLKLVRAAPGGYPVLTEVQNLM